MTTIPEISLDLIQTLALAGVVYAFGIGLKRAIPLLARLSIPAAVVGGLSFALFATLSRGSLVRFSLDTSAQSLFMVTFFTSIGMGASWSLLKRGGTPVVVMLVLATVLALVQNFVGIGLASMFGIHPLIGVIAGSLTLVGGPATGMAFAPAFEEVGVQGAGVLAITSATFGIVCAGIAGGPLGTFLIRRDKLKTHEGTVRGQIDASGQVLQVGIDQEKGSFVVSLLVLGVCMGVGSLVSRVIAEAGWTLPAYIGSMIVAAGVANVLEVIPRIPVDFRLVRLLGSVSLNIFLVVALMNLRLWELVNLALPLSVILTFQVAIALAFSVFVMYRLMGRDYDAATMAAGFLGFVLGTTANAVSNMETIVERYGDSARAFLVVPIVGGFFIDFTNALVINAFLNWFR